MREYHNIWVRQSIGWIVTVTVPVYASILLGYVLDGDSLLGSITKPVLLSILVVLTLLGISYFAWFSLDGFIWRVRRRLRYRKPRIGIIREPSASPHNSNYGPIEWKMKLKESNIDSEDLNSREISGRFAVIINPYGEGYPEEDAVGLSTFASIEDFVYNGGILVSVGGYPFYVALDTATGQPIPIAKPFAEGYEGWVDVLTGKTLLTKAVDRSKSSLYEGTLIWTRLRLRVTWGADEPVNAFQGPVDRQFAGSLIEMGMSLTVPQFRAFWGPLPSCHVIVRANSAHYGEVYPLVAVEFGRGLFIIGGVHLGLSGSRKGESEQAFSLSVRAVEAVLNGVRTRRIPIHDRRALKNA